MVWMKPSPSCSDGRNGIAPSRPPFIRYLVIDMAAELEIELAVPTGAPVAGSGRVRPGVLPEGRYAVLRHTGPYDDGLIAWHDPDTARNAGANRAGKITPYGCSARRYADPQESL